MKKDIDVIDLFNEEINKKEKKLDRKIEKARKKEEKKEKKRKKELEQQEEEGFNEYLKQIKEDKILEESKTVEINPPINQLEIVSSEFEEDLVEPPKKNKEIEKDQIIKAIQETEIKKEENSLENLLNMEDQKKDKINENKAEKYTVLNTLLVILSVVLIFIGGDYVIYNSISNYTNLSNMINSIIFALMMFFYLLSILLKNKRGIKTFQILSLICMICFMGYYLFIA